jgi:hypothetical protein
MLARGYQLAPLDDPAVEWSLTSTSSAPPKCSAIQTYLERLEPHVLILALGQLD